MNKNMNKKEIIEMEVIMSDIADAKGKVEKTMKYWQTILDELDRRAMEYSELLSLMKAKEEEDKKRRDSVESMMKLNLRGQVFDTTKYTLLNGDSTYFSILLSSNLWELDGNGEFFIDRCGHGFDRILDYMSTGVLSTEGLNRYDEDCVYSNLEYFKINYPLRVWDYSRFARIENLNLMICLQLQDGRLCGFTYDRSCCICIYNMDTNIIEEMIKVDTDCSISSIIQLEDGRLCSFPHNYTIKLWNIEQSGQSEPTIEGHTYIVFSAIQLLDGRLCSASGDRTIKVWNKDDGACELTINTLDSPYPIVQLRDGRICSGNYHMTLWNINTGARYLTLFGKSSTIYCTIIIDELRICSGDSDSKIKIWNASSGLCEKTLQGHKGWILDMMLLLDGRLCIVTDDVKIWNIETGVCDLTIYASARPCKVVQLHDRRIVVTDGSLVVYIIGE
jgi:BTB/POZ domain